MTKKKKFILTALLALVGVCLIVFSNMSQSSEPVSQEIDYDEYTRYLEEKLEEFILSMDGIKKANVILTLDTSSEQIYAQNQSNYDFLTISSGNG